MISHMRCVLVARRQAQKIYHGRCWIALSPQTLHMLSNPMQTDPPWIPHADRSHNTSLQCRNQEQTQHYNLKASHLVESQCRCGDCFCLSLLSTIYRVTWLPLCALLLRLRKIPCMGKQGFFEPWANAEKLNCLQYTRLHECVLLTLLPRRYTTKISGGTHSPSRFHPQGP